MLAKARRAADEAGVQLELREGDMQRFPARASRRRSSTARIALMLHLDLGRLPEGSSNAWPSRSEPGGRFAWNAFVFDPHVAVRMDGVARPHPRPGTLWEYVAHRPQDNRIDITAYVGEPGQCRDLQLWWVTRSEWRARSTSPEVEALYGWFDKRPFDDESAEFSGSPGA